MEVIIPMSTVVDVEYSNMMIRGKVVGRFTMGTTESYIVQCIDGQLPNDIYEYDTFITR